MINSLKAIQKAIVWVLKQILVLVASIAITLLILKLIVFVECYVLLGTGDMMFQVHPSVILSFVAFFLKKTFKMNRPEAVMPVHYSVAVILFLGISQMILTLIRG